jgi:hypothetical protein
MAVASKLLEAESTAFCRALKVANKVEHSRNMADYERLIGPNSALGGTKEEGQR